MGGLYQTIFELRLHPQLHVWRPSVRDRIASLSSSFSGCKIRGTSPIDRRTLLYAFGIASVSSMLPAQVATPGKVAVAKPGENRFVLGSAPQAKISPCKVSSEDSAGACTVFELNALPRSGPFLHVHHREDEWYYVLSGEFLFRERGAKSIIY